MNNLQSKVSKHTNDIIQKYVNALFRNATLDFYGIKTAPIKELANPELPVISVESGSTDAVFLLMDDSYLHFAFETGHTSKRAMIKSASYDIRLFERDGRTVHTVIIYTYEVKNRPPSLKIGSLEYAPDIILMNDYDGDTIFAEIETKIKSGTSLTDVDLLNLVLLPIMRHTKSRIDLAMDTIKLAQKISDTIKREACIASAFAFANKFLDETDKEKLLGVIKMTDLAVMLMDDKAIEIAKSMLKDKVTIEFVARHTGLDVSTVEKLKMELDND